MKRSFVASLCLCALFGGCVPAQKTETTVASQGVEALKGTQEASVDLNKKELDDAFSTAIRMTITELKLNNVPDTALTLKQKMIIGALRLTTVSVEVAAFLKEKDAYKELVDGMDVELTSQFGRADWDVYVAGVLGLESAAAPSADTNKGFAEKFIKSAETKVKGIIAFYNKHISKYDISVGSTIGATIPLVNGAMGAFSLKFYLKPFDENKVIYVGFNWKM